MNSRLFQIKKKLMLAYRLKYSGKFYNRSKGAKKVCIVLAGYKPTLYENVFGRLKRFIDIDIDVCIITSGKYSAEIDRICEDNEWSYLSTKENNVSLVQNVAIMLHPYAELIFKMDEDIFITEHYFSKMEKAFHDAKNTNYNPGIMSPVIPVNGYGYIRVLKQLNLMNYFEDNFEKPIYGGGKERMIENNPKVASFFWGEGDYVPGIDQLNHIFENSENGIYPCAIRMSIGAILFERSLWEEMWYFRVHRLSNSLGEDEAQICTFCLLNSKAIMVTENTVVGHLGFGKQNKYMMEFFQKNSDNFSIK